MLVKNTSFQPLLIEYFITFYEDITLRKRGGELGCQSVASEGTSTAEEFFESKEVAETLFNNMVLFHTHKLLKEN